MFYMAPIAKIVENIMWWMSLKHFGT